MDFKAKYEYKDLLKTYRKLAKRADQRLVRLEGYRHDKGYEKITSYAYRSAMKDIKSWSGEKSKRFNTAPPKNIKDLMKKIADIEKFLDAPTSTKKGVIEVYKNRADAINKRFFGDDKKMYLTWDEYANFWDRMAGDMVDKLKYRDAAEAAALMKKYKLTPENIRERSEKLYRSDKIDDVQLNILNNIAERGLSLSDLVGK